MLTRVKQPWPSSLQTLMRLWSTLRILWGSNAETRSYEDIIRGQMSLILSIASKLPPLSTVSIPNLFLLPERQHSGGGDMLSKSQSQLGIVSWNDALRTIGPIDITMLNKQQRQIIIIFTRFAYYQKVLKLYIRWQEPLSSTVLR